MKTELKRMTAFLVAAALCSSMMMHSPNDDNYGFNLSTLAAEGDVAIDAANFPDAAFRAVPRISSQLWI